MGYTSGQCTAFVASFFPWAANTQWGDAYQWVDRARRDGHAISSQPVVGSIAVWGQNVGGALSDGHVAAVIGIDKNTGNPIVTEMNWSNGPFNQDTRTVSSASAQGIVGYIMPSGVAGAPIASGGSEALTKGGASAAPKQSATLTSANPLDWASGLGTIFSDVLSAAWWYRVGFVALGVALIVGGGILIMHKDVEAAAEVAAL